MTAPFGGARDRLVWNAVHTWFHEKLDALGWFGVIGDATATPPVQFPSIQWITRRLPDNVPVPPNALTISTATLSSEELETGSSLTADGLDVWIEFTAVDEELGRQVSGDIMAIAQGKYPTIGCIGDHIPVYERPGETDPGDILFYVEVSDVKKVENAQNPPTPELRFETGLNFIVTDERP